MSYVYNLTEQQAAELFGVTDRTIRNWRRSHMPDYLYRLQGRAGHSKIRYCRELLLRWQAIDPDDVSGLAEEEKRARRELDRSLAGGKR
jgi:hypothetical protein